MKRTFILILFALFTLQGCMMHDGYGRRSGGYERSGGDHDRRGGGDHDRRGGGDREGGHDRRH